MTILETTPTNDTRLGAIVDDVVGAIQGVVTAHRVTWEEYRAATDWLMSAGQQGFEIPLLMDVFLSTTVDDVQSPDAGGTESNVEGPFYIAEAPMLTRPYALPMREDEPGDVLVFSGTVRATDGSPLAGALVDVWQDNGAGEYSHFHPGVPEHNLRGRLVANDDGRFEFRTVLPVPYEIPTNGATGRLLAALGRPAFRPAHVHFKVSHEAARPLTTQIYFCDDPWLDGDVVVGAVKESLVTPVVWHDANGEQPHATCSYDFVLPPVD
jgi:catechol 1,2-dioxygenase